MEIHFREFEEDDFSYCNSLIESNMKEYFESTGIQWDPNRFRKEIAKSRVRIVTVGEDRAGFLHLSEKGKYGYLNTIQISPAFRNLGIGSRILSRIEEECKSRGNIGIQLSVYKSSPAFRLYQRMGYVVLEEGEQKFLMEKKM